MKNHEITLNHKIREHWEVMCHKHIILSYIHVITKLHTMIGLIMLTVD